MRSVLYLFLCFFPVHLSESCEHMTAPAPWPLLSGKPFRASLPSVSGTDNEGDDSQVKDTVSRFCKQSGLCCSGRAYCRVLGDPDFCGRAAASSGEGQACPGCTHEEQDAPHTGPQGPRILVLLLKISLGFLRVKR